MNKFQFVLENSGYAITKNYINYLLREISRVILNNNLKKIKNKEDLKFIFDRIKTNLPTEVLDYFIIKYEREFLNVEKK